MDNATGRDGLLALLEELRVQAVSQRCDAQIAEAREGPVGHILWGEEIKLREQREAIFEVLKRMASERVDITGGGDPADELAAYQAIESEGIK